MKEIYDLIREQSPLLLALAIIGYFVKVYLERKIDGIENRVEAVTNSSLAIKESLRKNELTEIIKCREAIELWEHFLLNSLFDAAAKPSLDTDIVKMARQEDGAFLRVKLSIVRTSIFLRSEELELRLLDSVMKIRKLYYPLIQDFLPRLIELQNQLRAVDAELNRYVQSGGKEGTYENAQVRMQQRQQLQNLIASTLKEFSEKIVGGYRAVAEQLADLKKEMNRYVYRPIESTAINKD